MLLSRSCRKPPLTFCCGGFEGVATGIDGATSTAGDSIGNSGFVLEVGDMISEGDIIGGGAEATAAAAAAAYLMGGNVAFEGVDAAATAGTEGTGGTSALDPIFGNSCFVLSIVPFRLGTFFAIIGLGGISSRIPPVLGSFDALLAGVGFLAEESSLAGVFGAGVARGESSMGSTREAESRDCSSCCRPNSPGPKSSSSSKLRSSYNP